MAEALVPLTRRRQRLLRELRELRVAAGMTCAQAAELIERSGSALYRMEEGQVARIRWGDVERLCRGYGAPDEVRERLVTLAKETAKRSKGWWDAFGPATPSFQTLISLEDEAERISAWYPTLIPGLLQTEAYARALMLSSLTITDPDEIERQVQIRLARQTALDRADAPLQLWAVLDESVLHRAMGGREVMRQQLQAVLDASERSNVTVQMVPFGVGGHAGLAGGPVVLFAFADPGDVGCVYLENHYGALHLEEPEEVAAYSRLVDHVRSSASSAPATRDRIAQIAATL